MSEKKFVLLTGATGVVGGALLPRLAHHRVVSLTHRARIDGEQVHGDLTAPMLGLGLPTYQMLTERVDTVVHAAAVTDFAAGEQATADLNIAGTRRVLDFAADAGAKVLYVSTAFVAREGLTREARGGETREAVASPAAYLGSKRAAEDLVTSSGLHTAIARPSVVIGDSATGEIARFQGLHGLVSALLRNQLPLVPLELDSRVDVIPADVVASALAALVDAGVPRGEHWLTSGPAAPTARAVIDVCLHVAAELGIAVERPRFVSAGMVDRLLRPVFIDPLPKQARRKFDDLMAMTALFSDATPFPTSLGLTEQGVAEGLAASVRYLAHAKGLVALANAAERAA